MAEDLKLHPYSSSPTGFLLKPRVPSTKVYETIPESSKVFNRTRYTTAVSAPKPLFTTHLEELKLPRCLDMPLRLKGETLYSVPKEWEALLPLIQETISLEHAANPSVVNDYYTYLTVDSSHVEAQMAQRRAGLHVDGFQGARIAPKTKVTRNYVVSSSGGTRFYPQLFDSCLDDSIYDLFKGFDLQVQDAAPYQASPNTVYFMDAYTVHESGIMEISGWRTFVRLTYDCKRFDRWGNTHNSMLSYDWPMVARNVQDTLIDPARDPQAAHHLKRYLLDHTGQGSTWE